MSLQAFVAAANSRDAAQLKATLSPAFAGKANGRALDGDGQVRLIQSFWDGFPTGSFAMEATGGHGRGVITWTFAGTHDGPYLGVPATGTAITLSGFIVAAFDATGITSLDWKWDTKAFMRAAFGSEPIPDLTPPPPRHRPDPSHRWTDQKGGKRKPKRKGKGPRQGPAPARETAAAPAPEPAPEAAAPAAAADAPPPEAQGLE